MASGMRSKSTNIFVYVLLGLLVLGLAGFGVGNFGGTVRSIGAVGKTDIPVESYANALQQELRAMQAQTGQTLTMAQAVSMGLDRQVLARLVAQAALDEEARRLGISVGDETVAHEIAAMPEFQGATGGFDREGYRFVLEQAGLTPAAFEEQVRADITRSLLVSAVTGGVPSAPGYTDALITFLSEQRALEWARLDATALEAPLPTPDDGAVRAYYEANAAEFTLPEQRKIAYVWLTPDMIVDSVEAAPEAARALYDERAEEFNRPERRLLERLVFGSEDDAAAARARIDAGETSFEDEVTARGLALGDIDLGDMRAEDLPAAVSDAIFAMDGPGIAGPLPSELGPALYRMNAVLSAVSTPYEDVADDLAREAAMGTARRQIEGMISEVDDLLAGGATLDEVAETTELKLGEVTLPDNTGVGIAGYDAFREAADSATTEDYAEVHELSDGGIFALELREVIPPALQPLDDVRDAAAAGALREATRAALVSRAEALVAQLDEGALFSELGMEAFAEDGLTRESFVEGTPPALVARAFELEPGKTAVVEGVDDAYLLRLTSITPPDEKDPDVARIRTLLDQQYVQGTGQGLADLLARALQTRAGITLNQQAINAVHSQFP